jgi:hypothetical protein
MIRPLRRMHLFVWVALALLLPTLLVAAIAVRRIDRPFSQSSPANPVESTVRGE